MKKKGKKWEVTWDLPIFEGSLGKLVYIEVVEAESPQIAKSEALTRFIAKMQWALDNRMKSIGGAETGVKTL